MLSRYSSVTTKALGIALMALLMLIPLAQVRDLIAERSGYRQHAVAQIASRWGAAQTVGGPVISVPHRVMLETKDGYKPSQQMLYLLPERGDISATLTPSIRAYGIYDTAVYTADVTISARYESDDFAPLSTDAANYLTDQVKLRFLLSDVRGLREVKSVKVNGTPQRLQPGDAIGNIAAVSVALDPSLLAGALTVEVQYVVAGTESLQFLPMARTTTVKVDAPWADPSFTGAFLPAERDIDDKQFSARWQVLELNRGFAQHWEETPHNAVNLHEWSFGVTLYRPVDVYQQLQRAGKYGLLFIGLSFVAFFLFEVLKKLRVHPVQYVLVGLALCTFYILLLALSEQIGFGGAYAVAATAVVLIIGGYAAAVLATRRAGGLLAGCLAVAYLLLYGLVISEQYSLLIGAITLLAVVSVLMYLTRRIDWYGESRPAAAPAAAKTDFDAFVMPDLPPNGSRR
ncbi:cell envelope integrity protein CreD [Tahibacter amnicola]|uniref:Cell envelope integrity protein CreD n=1 Tax=Tahibacter amnicola TaxID=2976241 RepID=A0ABY6BCI7_9GAMM|nr:cell envelope integrity protein CreD [Tahibacter amnicola]UXI67517.1 cell envelope integrity protein CreD [Tahibacter amnicola]